MHRITHLIALIATAATTLTAVVVTPADADACSWEDGVIRNTLPEDGAEVPPDAELSLWFKPGSDWIEWEFEILDDDGDDVDIETDRLQYGVEIHRVDHFRVIPESPLDPGTHTLTVSPSEDYPDDITLSFTVTDDNIDAPPTPDDIHWTRIDDPNPDTCYGSSPQWHDIVIDEDRDDVWFEFDYDTDEDGVIATHPVHEQLRHNIAEETGCFTVETVAIDGTRSDPVERCEPDVCKSPEDDFGPLEEVDCDTGEPLGDNDDSGDDDNGDDTDDDESNDQAESACSAGAGPGSLLWAIAFLAAIAVLTRRPNRMLLPIARRLS